MPDKNPFGNNKLSFFTGLTGQLMNNMKEEADRRRQEDAQREQMDYQLLMAGLEKMLPDLTPSQVAEVLGKGVDIFKPKGGGTLKQRLGELFGGGQGPYQMQSGNILGNIPPPKTTTTYGDKTVMGEQISGLPTTTKEQTYRERGIEDEERKYAFQLEKQDKAQKAQDDRQAARINAQKEIETQREKARRDLASDNYSRSLNKMSLAAKLKARAAVDARKEALRASMPNATDEELTTAAERDVYSDINLKREVAKAQIAAMNQLTTERGAQTTKLQQEIANPKMAKDPQIQGMWKQYNDLENNATVFRRQYTDILAKAAGETDENTRTQLEATANGLLEAAQQAEGDADAIRNAIENRAAQLKVPAITSSPSGGNKGGGTTEDDPMGIFTKKP